MKRGQKHHSSGFANCIDCATLLANEDPSLNVYWCKKCQKSSVATKPTKYRNCPCGCDMESLADNNK